MDLEYPCPSCGFLVFDEEPGSYSICPICGWEDDNVQLKYPAMRGGANGGSLAEYQQKLLESVPVEVSEHFGYRRCAEWRPLRKDEVIATSDEPATGMDYFNEAAEESVSYYWKKGK